MEAELKLAPEQAPAWRQYLETMEQLAHKAPEPPASADRLRAMTVPQRLDYMVDHIEADLASVQARATAVAKLYAALTPEQRAIVDREMTPEPETSMPAPETASSAEPARLNYRLPSHTAPNWRVRPRPDDIARVYPHAAVEANLSGVAQMRCAVDIDGYLSDCIILSETPEGQGFGNAALEMTGYMRMYPATRYGVPVPGTVTMPVRFHPPGDDAPSRPASASPAR